MFFPILDRHVSRLSFFSLLSQCSVFSLVAVFAVVAVSVLDRIKALPVKTTRLL